jgi:hypothetical protein
VVDWDPLSLGSLLSVLEDRRNRCSECGEYFADWIDEKGLRREGQRAPKSVSHMVRPCACAAIEMAGNRSEEERPPGAKVVLVANPLHPRS